MKRECSYPRNILEVLFIYFMNVYFFGLLCGLELFMRSFSFSNKNLTRVLTLPRPIQNKTKKQMLAMHAL